MKKVTYQEVRTALDKIQKSGMQAHYVLGAYEVMLANLIAELPARSAVEEMKMLESLANRVSTINP
jgi:hypothetical protein